MLNQQLVVRIFFFSFFLILFLLRRFFFGLCLVLLTPPPFPSLFSHFLATSLTMTQASCNSRNITLLIEKENLITVLFTTHQCYVILEALSPFLSRPVRGFCLFRLDASCLAAIN